MTILPNQIVKTKWIYSNKKWYEQKGYIFTHYNDEFGVKLEDLIDGSHSIVKVICDYCGEIIDKTYANYRKSRNKSVIQKDCCKECIPIKCKEVTLLKYGVEHVSKIPQVVEKIKEKQRLSEDIVRKKFEEFGYIMIGEYVNYQTPIEYICPRHGLQKITYASLYMGHGCRLCGYESFSGENHYCWNGGTKPLREYLHNNIIKQWKLDSMNNCNYKCVITGDRFDDVHHLYNFQDILYETLNLLNLEFKLNIGDYTTEEMKNIEETCLRLHYKYGLGVCLRRDVHKLFHSIYGKSNNTPEQFEEFKNNYLNGMYDEIKVS